MKYLYTLFALFTTLSLSAQTSPITFGEAWVVGTDNWTMTLDYYDFVIDNPIQNQNYAQLAAAYEAGGAAKAAIQSQIYGGTNLTNDGSFTAAQIGRIRSNFVNGAEVQTNGLDL